MKSPVTWLTDDQYTALPIPERALIVASVECDVKHVREVGDNRGKNVEEYLASVGLGGGYPWCAAFVSWCLLQAGLPKAQLPKGAAAVRIWRDWAQKEGRLKTAVKDVKRGDLFCWVNAKGTGHIGFVIKNLGNGKVATIEGNTDGAGSREGNGVYRKERIWKENFRAIRLA